MTVERARDVIADRTGIRDDNADGADLDDRFWYDVDRRKQPIDKVSAFDQHLKLPTAASTGREEARWFLEIVVERGRIGGGAYLRRDDFAAVERWPVMHRD